MKITIDFEKNNTKEIVVTIDMLRSLLTHKQTARSYKRNGAMHPTAVKILELSKTIDLGTLKLREIGRRVGIDHPQKIAHHIGQLEKKGYLIHDKRTI